MLFIKSQTRKEPLSTWKEQTKGERNVNAILSPSYSILRSSASCTAVLRNQVQMDQNTVFMFMTLPCRRCKVRPHVGQILLLSGFQDFAPKDHPQEPEWPKLGNDAKHEQAGLFLPCSLSVSSIKHAWNAHTCRFYLSQDAQGDISPFKCPTSHWNTHNQNS